MSTTKTWISRGRGMLGAIASISACSEDVAGTSGAATDPGTTGSPTSFDLPDPNDTTPTTGSSTTHEATGSTGEDASTNTTGSEPGAICGDGEIDAGEACDAGPANDAYAACTDACQWNLCGDGNVLVGVEACDEGANNVDTGYCRSDCTLGVCGDGFVLAGLEECDDGEANGDKYGACDPSCTVNRCGDGVLDAPYEQCDEGPDNGRGGVEDGMTGCALDCGFAGRLLFLSSQVFTGDMNSRAGADVACQAMAMAAKFRHPEKFRALLADAFGSPNTYVQPDPTGRPFIAPGGLVLAADYAALIDQGPGNGVTLTDTGETLINKLVWTNVGPLGGAYSVDPAETCSDWKLADITLVARLGVNAVDPDDPAALATWQAEHRWLSAHSKWCDQSYRIYCIEAS